MDRSPVAHELLTYLIGEVRAIRDPQDRQQHLLDFDGVRHRHIKDVAEVFTCLLVKGSDHPLLASLADDILGAFDGFRTHPGDKQQLRQCVGCLAESLEPFWKWILYLIQNKEPREKGGPDTKALLQDVLPHSWRDGNDFDRFVAFARQWRHLKTHNAPDATEVDLRIYLEAAFGVHLLVVEENYDALAAIALSDVRRTLRDQVQLQQYLDNVAHPSQLTEYYIPLALEFDGTNEKSTSVTDAFDRFRIDTTTPALLLLGKAGSGKSTFLRWWLAGIAQEQLALGPAEHPHQIPLYYQLRNLPCIRGTRVDQVLLQHITRWGWHLSQAAPEEVFGVEEISWVICLDGLDELREWDIGIQLVEEFLAQYFEKAPSVKVVLTSRPELLDDAWSDRFAVLTIEDWSEHEVQAYAYRRAPGLARYFLDWLHRGQLLDLVRVPILLEKTMDFWLQSRTDIEQELERCKEAERSGEHAMLNLIDVVPPVRAVDHAVRGFLEHQLVKLSGPSRFRKVDGLMTALRQLAFTLDGKLQLEADKARMVVGNALDELVGMSLLTRSHQAVQFGHDVVKLCFAAQEFGYRLSEEVRTPQQLESFISSLHGEQGFWQKCKSIAPLVLPLDVPYPTWLFHS